MKKFITLLMSSILISTPAVAQMSITHLDLGVPNDVPASAITDNIEFFTGKQIGLTGFNLNGTHSFFHFNLKMCGGILKNFAFGGEYLIGSRNTVFMRFGLNRSYLPITIQQATCNDNKDNKRIENRSIPLNIIKDLRAQFGDDALDYDNLNLVIVNPYTSTDSLFDMTNAESIKSFAEQ
jgi:hypothetical protein